MFVGGIPYRLDENSLKEREQDSGHTAAAAERGGLGSIATASPAPRPVQPSVPSNPQTRSQGLASHTAACANAVFEKYNPDHAVIQLDKLTQKPRGFGFVLFKDRESMLDAIRDMHNKDVDGRPISVKEAIPQDKIKPGTPAAALDRPGAAREGMSRYDRGGYERRGYDRAAYAYDRGYGGGYDRGYGGGYDRAYAADPRYDYGRAGYDRAGYAAAGYGG